MARRHDRPADRARTRGLGNGGRSEARTRRGAERASGAILKSRGIMGGSRGLKHKRPDGTQQRPDFILIDDPQTDESASTPLQVNKRLNVVRKNILKLGGHGRKLAVVMNATCIRKGDMVDRIADAKAFPAWQGVRIKMVRKWSDAHETLWLTTTRGCGTPTTPTSWVTSSGRTARRRRSTAQPREDGRGLRGVLGTLLRPGHRAESAIQHAYNLLIDDGPEVFASECQNDPQEEREEGQQQTLSPTRSARSSTVWRRGELPAGAEAHGFIDPNQSLLAWIVCAFAQDFTGDVVDYGTYPDQGRAYFSMKDARHTLEKAAPGAGSFEAALYAGLDALVNQLMGREWKRAGRGAAQTRADPDRRELAQGNRRRREVLPAVPHAAILLPSRGHFVGAKSKPMGQYKPTTGDRTGLNWRIPNVRGTRQIAARHFDTNFWKSFVHARLARAMGGKGALTLFGKPSKGRPADQPARDALRSLALRIRRRGGGEGTQDRGVDDQARSARQRLPGLHRGLPCCGLDLQLQSAWFNSTAAPRRPQAPIREISVTQAEQRQADEKRADLALRQGWSGERGLWRLILRLIGETRCLENESCALLADSHRQDRLGEKIRERVRE
jgi:hypothetical protein